ncbi:Cytochrome c7 c [uncultured archaeon]|nr:Cytochrome c7 c [uncultured archaeon]
MDRRGNFSYICSMLKSDKQKLTARIITGATVLFLIIAGTPFFNMNTNGVNAASNPYASPSISNLANSGPTSSGSFIFWDTNVSANNRVYYGLNEANVNNLTNGSWSTWNNNTFNVSIRLSGLSANTTYYYKPESWYLGAANDSISPSLLVTLKPGVWTSPSEYMVSPPGWTGSPVNFRTVNISAAILNDIGRYITGLSLEAVIYNSTGGEIGRANLSGTGPYLGNFTLPDYLDEGGYVIRITGYPNVAGEFSVLRWGCANCHTNNYPSTFNPLTAHPRHFDTTDITSLNVVHCADDACTSQTTYTSISQCDGCHALSYPNPQMFPGVQHPQSGACSDCHKSPSGGNAALACVNCHNDITTTDSYLSPRYGQDRHYSNATCNDCHGTLTSLTTKPNCTSCHPRPGSILNNTNIPGSIENTSHSLSQTVSCGLCHNREHDVKSLQTLDITVCRTCHPGINHNGGAQCTTCHGSDPHRITFAGGTDCVGCHGTNYTGANPMVSATFLVDINAFNDSIHQNINNTPPDTVNNNDCWMCHYQQDMNRSHIRKCGDCHRKPSQWHGNANVTTNWSLIW